MLAYHLYIYIAGGRVRMLDYSSNFLGSSNFVYAYVSHVLLVIAIGRGMRIDCAAVVCVFSLAPVSPLIS